MNGDRYDYDWSDPCGDFEGTDYANPNRERLARLERDRTGYRARTRCIACGVNWGHPITGLCYQTLDCRGETKL